jgi:molecular chaperone IbpA
MRTNYDFTPLRRSTVGFDRLFDLLENGLTSQVTDNYPPFDLVSEGEDRHRINMAVAGFAPARSK